ncbi:ATP-binding protein [Caenimonas terrae]|uniref:histidine kinase n=1 Tax=Caenimonas terrae TaxID=696074 RepID=A0ABW0N6L0_9BURK
MTSLRVRLLGIIGASLLVLWTLVAVWMFIDLRSQMRAALDQRLAASARMVAALVGQLPATPGPARPPAGPLLDVVARDGLACEVSLLRGEVMPETVARTASSPRMAEVAPGYSTQTFGGKQWRTYVLQQGGIRVATADRLDVREGLMRDIGLAAAVPFAVALAGSLLLLWFAIGRGLAPIEAIRRQLARRRPDDDAALAPTAVPAELSPLVGTIGHLLERVRGVIARERRFTDDAAHELRTPLTAVKTHLQVLGLALERDPVGPAVAQSLAHASEGVLRMQRTLEQLLLLARLDGDLDSQDGEQADAYEAAGQAVRDAEAGSGNPGRVRLAAAAGPLAVAVPPMLLVSALRNLLDNALRYAPDGSPVLLEIDAADGNRIRFTVLDRGPGMTPAECAQAVERFWRRSRTPLGSGLGLSIASTIAMRYQGEVRLAPRPGGGLRAELILPAAAE